MVRKKIDSFALAQKNIIFLLLALALLACIFVFLGSILPLLGMIPGLPALQHNYVTSFFAYPGIWQSIWGTVYVGLGSFFLSLLWAHFLLQASVFGHKKNYIYRYLIVIAPHSALAIGLLFLFFPAGLLIRLTGIFVSDMGLLQSWWFVPDPFGISLMLVLSFKEAIFIYISALTLIQQIEYENFMSKGFALGYHPKAMLRKVIYPIIAPQMRLPFAIVLFYSFSVVDISILVGPSIPPLLPVRLVEFMQHPNILYKYDAAFGALILWVLMVLCYVAIIICMYIYCKPHFLLNLKRQQQKNMPHHRVWNIHNIYKILLIVGFIWLLLWSFFGYIGIDTLMPATFTLKNWLSNKGLMEAAWHSFIIAVSASFIATACMSIRLFIYHHKNHFYVFLPVLVPELFFVFGLYFFMQLYNIPPSLYVITIAHIIYILPYSYLLQKGSFQKTPIYYYQYGASLGKNMWQQYFYIALPLNAKAFCLSFIIGVAVSCNLYLPSFFAGGFGVIPTLLTENIFYFESGNPRLLSIAAITNIIIPLSIALFSIALYNYCNRFKTEKEIV